MPTPSPGEGRTRPISTPRLAVATQHDRSDATEAATQCDR